MIWPYRPCMQLCPNARFSRLPQAEMSAKWSAGAGTVHQKYSRRRASCSIQTAFDKVVRRQRTHMHVYTAKHASTAHGVSHCHHAAHEQRLRKANQEDRNAAIGMKALHTCTRARFASAGGLLWRGECSRRKPSGIPSASKFTLSMLAFPSSASCSSTCVRARFYGTLNRA